jgi:hypothetical protein
MDPPLAKKNAIHFGQSLALMSKEVKPVSQEGPAIEFDRDDYKKNAVEVSTGAAGESVLLVEHRCGRSSLFGIE